jgi:hypothetical protein
MSDNINQLYPDVTAAGSLRNALQSALNAIGSELKVTSFDGSAKFVAYARVESGPRFSQVYIAAKERLFLSDFWSRGVMLAGGKTPDLAGMASAINRWVAWSCTTGELASEFTFVVVESRAAAYESGEEVEYKWQGYLETIADRYPELAAFVQAASKRQELRQLFPYTSLNAFCFSRCTGYPFTRDTPFVGPLRGGQYQVVDPAGQVLGTGDAETAADLLVGNLPPGCGRAIAGTADDIARV